MGGLIALGGLAGIVNLLKTVMQPGVPAEATIGGLLLAALIVVALVCIVQICFYRARSVDALRDSDYTVVPIVSIAARACGEIVGTLGMAVGVGGFFAILLSGPFGAQLLGESGLPSIFLHESASQSSFIAAVSVLAYAAAMSVASVLFLYFFAEICLALVDVASQLQRRSAATVGSIPAAVKCAGCGARMELDSEFCEQCGAPRASTVRSAQVARKEVILFFRDQSPCQMSFNSRTKPSTGPSPTSRSAPSSFRDAVWPDR
jgi:hypothetical protein